MTSALLRVATALPAIVLAVASLLMVVLALAGVDTIWVAEADANLSEAAALQDRGTIVRLIRRGEDPRRPHVVRAGFLGREDVTLTAFETAIAARRPEVLDVLLAESRGVDAEMWAALTCQARAANDRGSEQVLERYRPAETVPACETAPAATEGR